MKSRKNNLWLFWSLFVIMIALDQGVKLWARTAFVEHQAMTVIPNVLDLTLTYNRGIAFGLFPGAGVILAPVAIAIALGAMVYSLRHPYESKWYHTATSLLAAGALGNLYDRLVHGKVTDMLWVRFVNFPVFNVADSCITIAAAILIIRWAREAVEPAKPAPAVAEEFAPVEGTYTNGHHSGVVDSRPESEPLAPKVEG